MFEVRGKMEMRNEKLLKRKLTRYISVILSVVLLVSAMPNDVIAMDLVQPEEISESISSESVEAELEESEENIEETEIGNPENSDDENSSEDEESVADDDGDDEESNIQEESSENTEETLPEESGEENTDSNNHAQMDAPSNSSAPIADTDWSVIMIDGEYYEYDTSSQQEAVEDKDGNSFKVTFFHIRKWNEDDKRWDDIEDEYALNVNDTDSVTYLVRSGLEMCSYLEFENCLGYEYEREIPSKGMLLRGTLLSGMQDYYEDASDSNVRWVKYQTVSDFGQYSGATIDLYKKWNYVESTSEWTAGSTNEFITLNTQGKAEIFNIQEGAGVWCNANDFSNGNNPYKFKVTTLMKFKNCVGYEGPTTNINAEQGYVRISGYGDILAKQEDYYIYLQDKSGTRNVYRVKPYCEYYESSLTQYGSDYYIAKSTGQVDADGYPVVEISSLYWSLPENKADYGLEILSEEEQKQIPLLTKICSKKKVQSGAEDNTEYIFKESKTIKSDGNIFKFNVYEEYVDGTYIRDVAGRDKFDDWSVHIKGRYCEFVDYNTFVNDIEQLPIMEVVNKYGDEIDDDIIEFQAKRYYCTESERYGLTNSVAGSGVTSDGVMCVFNVGFIYDKTTDVESPKLYQLDENGYLIDNYYDFEDAEEYISSHTAQECDREFSSYSGWTVQSGTFEAQGFSKLIKDEYEYYYYKLDESAEKAELFGANYKLVFDKLYYAISSYELDEFTGFHKNYLLDKTHNSLYDYHEFMNKITDAKTKTDLAARFEVPVEELANYLSTNYGITLSDYSGLNHDNPGFDISEYTYLLAETNHEGLPLEVYFKKTGSKKYSLVDGYFEFPICSGYCSTDGSDWYPFENQLVFYYDDGEETEFFFWTDELDMYFTMQFTTISYLDSMLAEEGLSLDYVLPIYFGQGVICHRYSDVPIEEDVKPVDEESYYKLKQSNTLFKQFSDGKVYGDIYVKYELGLNHRFNENSSVVYLIKFDEEGEIEKILPSTYAGSYEDACREFGNLEQVFGCRFEKGSNQPSKNPSEESHSKIEEFVEEIADVIIGGDFGSKKPVESLGQLQGTGSLTGWEAIEKAIIPENKVNGTYTVWGSKTMSVPNTVIDKMQSEKITMANFALTEKTMFSIQPSMKTNNDFFISIDARCWNDNIKKKETAPSVPAAIVLQNGGTVMSDILTVKCSNKDVKKTAVITSSKLQPKAKTATLYVYNPKKKELVPYKTLKYGRGNVVQFEVPCLTATYVVIEN